MDITTVILEGLRVILGFLLLLFVPGFALSLVIFPRFNDIGIVERLAYSTVLSIGSVIALVLFMDVVLGVDTTPVNIIIAICVFSYFAFFEWLCMVWYRKSTFKDRLEPRLSEDYQKVQSFYTREINAARDRFRQDTGTVVVYHEHQQSGLNLIDHSYLLDVGEEIAIQQVIENKVKVTDSVILPPPYPRIRYFELVIREYKEDGLSLVDDLQIYPVLIMKKPDRKFLGFVLKPGIPNITERLHQKTSTTEVEWIYSHDFHVFAIIHTEDTLDQMVDRILGTLDKITLSMKSGIHISSHAEDRQILKDAFDAVIIEKPREIPAKPVEIALQPETQFSAQLWEIPERPEARVAVVPKESAERPIILTGAEPGDFTKRPEVQVAVEPKEIPKRPVILAGSESKEIPKPPEILTGGVLIEIPKRPVIQTGPKPQEIPPSPVVQIGAVPKKMPKRTVLKTGPELKEISQPSVIETGAREKEIPKPPVVLKSVKLKVIPEPPDVLEDFELKEVQKRPILQTGVDSTQIVRLPEIQFSVEPREIFRHPPVQHKVEPKETTQPPKDQHKVEQLEIEERPKVPITIEPKVRDQRKLQKEILRDLDVFSITPDSFGKSKKNIENIIIPKKSDVPKKLADVEEDVKDLNWLYE